MNKKFLSAVLFGAMLATTTSTFVSCKDYDDDIAGLQEQIDGVKSNLTSEVASLRGELATAKSELQNELTSTKSDLASAKTELQNAINSKADAAKVTTLEGKVTTLEGKVATIESKITAIDTLASDLEALSKDLEGAKATNTEALNGIAADIKALDEKFQDTIGKTLTSLVLNPELYYGGIEAVSVRTIEYTALELDEVNANDDFSDDAAEDGDEVQMTPLLSATYHMNPSSAVVPTDLGSYNFLIADKEYKPFYGGRALKSEILSATPEAGDLTVTAKFTDGVFATGEEVTTLALEVEIEEGKVVTSDYAAVYAEAITDFVLNNEDSKEAEAHLYTTAAEAIKNEAIVNVAWNETVDLAKYVETHYLSEDGCADLPETTLKGYGFSYKYELVGYIDGVNETSQSAHAALSDSKLRPQLPVGGKAAAWGDAKQSQATIGRMPLVRVTLVDTNSNKNVAVGYIKVKITATPGENTIGAKESYTFTDEFTLSCAEELDDLKLAWYEIEESILAQLGISKAEFKNNYVFDATLLDKVGLDAKALTGDIVEAVTVAEATDEETGTTTDVLVMTVDANYAYEYFLKNKTITAIVRYAKETGLDALGNQTYDYVYVTLNWTPSPLNVNPEGTIADADKMKQYWFADDSSEGGSGYNEIHVNVNVPGKDKVTTTNFKKDILETFVDGDITISGVAEVYEDFQDLTTELVFADEQSTTPIYGVDGTQYVIKPYVNSSGQQQFRAYAVIDGVESTSGAVIAKIDGNEIVYVATETSKNILNAAGRDELAKNVTATVLVKESNKCKKSLVKLNNNTFDVKFLRPISVEQAEMDSFKDGVDVDAAGSKVALKLKFTDWRGYDFEESYYEHYGITAINANTAEATTNVSGTWAKLPAAMDLTYVPAEEFDNKDFGTLKYVNNQSEVGNFKIKVPFTVEYVWGTIAFEVELDVEKTVQDK